MKLTDFESYMSEKTMTDGTVLWATGAVNDLEQLGVTEWGADVLDDDLLAVEIEVNDQSMVLSTFCECDYFQQAGECKHVMATLLSIRDVWQQREATVAVELSEYEWAELGRFLARQAPQAARHWIERNVTRGDTIIEKLLFLLTKSFVPNEQLWSIIGDVDQVHDDLNEYEMDEALSYVFQLYRSFSGEAAEEIDWMLLSWIEETVLEQQQYDLFFREMEKPAKLLAKLDFLMLCDGIPAIAPRALRFLDQLEKQHPHERKEITATRLTLLGADQETWLEQHYDLPHVQPFWREYLMETKQYERLLEQLSPRKRQDQRLAFELYQLLEDEVGIVRSAALLLDDPDFRRQAWKTLDEKVLAQLSELPMDEDVATEWLIAGKRWSELFQLKRDDAVFIMKYYDKFKKIPIVEREQAVLPYFDIAINEAVTRQHYRQLLAKLTKLRQETKERVVLDLLQRYEHRPALLDELQRLRLT